MTRIGLIGLGRWGRRLAEVLNREALLSWCCSTSAGDGREWARSNLPQVRWTADVDELISAVDVDAVAIATPVSTHAALVRSALLGNKNVFVEKPLATDFGQAEALLRLATRRSKTLMVDHTFLFDANISKLIDLVRDDPPQRVFMRWAKWGTFNDPILWSLFPHDVALALSLVKQTPQRITCDGDPSDPGCHRSSVTLGYSRGVAVEIEIDRMVTARTKEVRVITRSGKTHVWVNGGLRGAHGSSVLLRKAGILPLSNAIRHFVDVVEGRSAPEFDATFAVEVTKVLCDIGTAQQAARARRCAGD